MLVFTYLQNVLLLNVTFPETAKIAKFHPISLTKKKIAQIMMSVVKTNLTFFFINNIQSPLDVPLFGQS